MTIVQNFVKRGGELTRISISIHSFKIHKNSYPSSIRPRVWQRSLVNLVRRRILPRNHINQDLLIHAGPGAGKTIGALYCFKTMKDEGLLSKMIVFCHRNSILNQWQKSSQSLGIHLTEFEVSNYQQEIDFAADGWIVTYQGASKKIDALKNNLEEWSNNSLLAIADEAHHLGVNPEEPEGPIWGAAFINITEKCKLRIGLTGTPFRADNLPFCSARKVQFKKKGEVIEQITPDLCVQPRELISTGDVRPLEFHFQDGWVEHAKKGNISSNFSLLSQEKRESWRARNLRRAINISDSSSIAVQLLIRARDKLEVVRKTHKNAAGLVIAKDIQHAHTISHFLQEDGYKVELVHSQDKGASSRLNNFQNTDVQWLVNVDMCSEGFDAPRLRIVAYLTNVVTRSRFIQGVTRAIRISKTRSLLEQVPRNPSHVFAPADPLLMEYARGWSISKPYLIQGTEPSNCIGINTLKNKTEAISINAVNDAASKIIKMNTPDLPTFLKK